MKLAALYNVWDSEELLPHSIESIIDHVQMVLICVQKISNYGEPNEDNEEIILDICDMYPENVFVYHYTPIISNGAMWNETQKRNLLLEKAKKFQCTHFLHMDCDEMYEDFGKAKQEYIDSGSEGSVCEMFTYFKHPTLRFENVDNYYVPFIHELFDNTSVGMHPEYPFYADPTRRVNCTDVTLISEKMHHFSYVRVDIERKIRNSSAKANIERSRYLEYYNSDLKEGDFIEGFDQKLIEVENLFNITI